MKVLAVAERTRGRLDEAVAELATAARALAGEGKTAVALLGTGLDAEASGLASLFDTVHVFDDASLAVPDAGRDERILEALARREDYEGIVLPHGNLTLDLAPPLAARLDRPLLMDVLDLRVDGARLEARRAVYGGKLHARYGVDVAGGVVVSTRGGAFAAAAPGGGGEMVAEPLPDVPVVHRRTVDTVEPDPGEVDISAAEILVAVGRGIEEEENIDLARDLARALGGELACSRPVVDKGWLPKARQVGTSGVTVKPKVYLALGISGSFQHVGGIKGSPFLVAVNKDAKAPIFGLADVGVVGDLFEIVPVLTEKVRAAKA